MDFVVGMGVTGLAVAKFLKRKGLAFATYDDRKSAAQVAEELGFEVKHYQPDMALPRWHAIRHVIASPGVALSHPVMAAAVSGGVSILSEIELAFRHTCGRMVAITGSNGKSTTTALIHHLLKSAGYDASLCGNIGFPFIEQVSDDLEHIHVVEVSSFQLEHVRDFRPEIGVLLNVVPDHLDRHLTFEAYRAAKMKLFQAQGPTNTAFIGADIDASVPGKGRLVRVPGPEICDDDDGFKLGDHFVIPNRVLPAQGTHLRSNALFACAVAARLGASAEAIAQALPSFVGLEHRFEQVGSLNDVLWINDSKATNVHAAQAALRTIDRPYVLILGGSDKGETFSSLDFSAQKPRAIVAYGATAKNIMRDLASFGPIHVHDFDAACLKAQALAQAGDAVLLAPACASFDQHQNFAARGRRFKAIFKEQEAAS